MLTPRFSCSQTADVLVISIYTPSVRAADVEIHVDGNLFSLHINPYFLRLNLPKRVREDDASSAQYDPSTGYLTVTLSKEVPGEHFEDLDLLAKLLAPRVEPKQSHPVIEVISNKDEAASHPQSETQNLDLGLEHQVFLEAARNDWQLPQFLTENVHLQPFTSPQLRYGFLGMHSGLFRHALYVENEANELGPDAESLTEEERRQRGEERVHHKFDQNYYLADFVNNEEIYQLVHWQHSYTPECSSSDGFSESEKLTMLRLPRKEYLPTVPQSISLHLNLITILFSAAYDTRTTLADPTTESAWTISVLTPAFASLSMPRTAAAPLTPQSLTRNASSILRDIFVSSYKRALAYPLYRSFDLCECCRLDVADILGGGRRTVLKCLLNVKSILDKHDAYYVYSRIWVDDYCVWIQSLASEEILRFLSTEVLTAKIEKRDLGWDLERLEKIAGRSLGRVSDSDDEDDDTLEERM